MRSLEVQEACTSARFGNIQTAAFLVEIGWPVPGKKGGKLGESAVNRNSRQHRPNRGYSNRRSPQLQKEVFATTFIGLMIFGLEYGGSPEL